MNKEYVKLLKLAKQNLADGSHTDTRSCYICITIENGLGGHTPAAYDLTKLISNRLLTNNIQTTCGGFLVENGVDLGGVSQTTIQEYRQLWLDKLIHEFS